MGYKYSHSLSLKSHTNLFFVHTFRSSVSPAQSHHFAPPLFFVFSETLLLAFEYLAIFICFPLFAFVNLSISCLCSYSYRNTLLDRLLRLLIR